MSILRLEIEKNHECSFFKRNDGPAFFVFFGSLFAGEYSAINEKIKWVDFLGRRPDFLNRYGSCPDLEKKFFTKMTRHE